MTDLFDNALGAIDALPAGWPEAGLLPHPYAALNRMMSPDELRDLETSEMASGQRQKIVMFEGKILDGRNRFLTGIKLGRFASNVDWRNHPDFIEFGGNGWDPDLGTDALTYVWDMEVRRHSSQSDLALRAARYLRFIAALSPLDAAKETASLKLPTQAELAKRYGISERLLNSGSVLLERAAPELLRAVDEHRVALTDAAEISKLAPETQREVAAAPDKKAAKQKVRAVKAKTPKVTPQAPLPEPVSRTTLALAQKDEAISIALTKLDPASPVLLFLGAASLALKAGTTIEIEGRTHTFPDQMEITLPALEIGDYGVALDAEGKLAARQLTEFGGLDGCFAGFHFGPGGMAGGRAGGDETPAIVPLSLWDLRFRPACDDPRGMTLVVNSPGAPWLPPFWFDLYPMAQDHLAGTSRHGATIADGRNRPAKLEGKGSFPDCNYHTSVAVLAHHGKQVPSLFEAFAGFYGVTERSASGERSETAGLDALRTSRFVYMATGQRWTWGHDGDPDGPRASLFGGSSWNDGYAGSRRADVAYWPDNSNEYYGARGRCDHLQLA